MSRSTLLLSLVTAGCYTDVEGHATALFPKDSDSSGASSWATSTGADASATSGMPAITHDPLPATPGSGDPWSMSTGEPENQPPEILHFEIEPDMLNEAGTAHASASFNEKVTKLELKVNGVDVPVGAPATFEWFFTATSKAKSDGLYQLELTAKDDEDQTDVATATLKVELPDTGAQRCVFEEQSNDGWFAGVVYGDALVLAGTLGWPTEAAVWRLDPDSCKPQFGSPWKISQWTDKALPGPSQAVGLAIDADGRTAIAANIGTVPDRLSYIAVLSPEGSLAWEQLGQAKGRIYSSITTSPEGFVVVGETQVSEDPMDPHYDGFVEGFDSDGTFLGAQALAAPLPGDDWYDEFNMFDIHPRAIAWSEELDRLVVVGERDVFDKNDTKRTRAFSAQYDLELNLVNTWTSSGLDAVEDALVAIAGCGGELVASGWVQAPGLKNPAVRWLDSAGDGSTKRRVDLLPGTSFQALACDLEGKFTAAASTPAGAAVIGFRSSDDPFLFNSEFVATSLLAAACDARGFCAVAGQRGTSAWLRVHHP